MGLVEYGRVRRFHATIARPAVFHRLEDHRHLVKSLDPRHPNGRPKGAGASIPFTYAPPEFDLKMALSLDPRRPESWGKDGRMDPRHPKRTRYWALGGQTSLTSCHIKLLPPLCVDPYSFTTVSYRPSPRNL
jgi:hypothetical protein